MSKSNLISSFLPNDLLYDLQIKEEDLNQIEEYTEKTKDTNSETLDFNLDFFSSSNSSKSYEEFKEKEINEKVDIRSK